MRKFFLILALVFSFNVHAADSDETTGVICRIVNYAHGLGGPMITVVIIGASLLAIFGRMPWPALFALGMFIAVFFGAPKIASMISPGDKEICKKCPDGKSPGTDGKCS